MWFFGFGMSIDTFSNLSTRLPSAGPTRRQRRSTNTDTRRQCLQRRVAIGEVQVKQLTSDRSAYQRGHCRFNILENWRRPFGKCDRKVRLRSVDKRALTAAIRQKPRCANVRGITRSLASLRCCWTQSKSATDGLGDYPKADATSANKTSLVEAKVIEMVLAI